MDIKIKIIPLIPPALLLSGLHDIVVNLAQILIKSAFAQDGSGALLKSYLFGTYMTDHLKRQSKNLEEILQVVCQK